MKVLCGRNTKLEAKQEAYEQDIKVVQAKVEAVCKEMDKVNARFGEIDVSLQTTVEKQKLNFRDIMKDQLEQEMVNVSETVKKEVSVSFVRKCNHQHPTSAVRHSRNQSRGRRTKR